MDMRKYVGAVFLKIEDIKASGPRRVTITEVCEGRFGKPDLTFDDGTRLSVNATNGRILLRTYGTDGDAWIGKRIELVLGTIDYQGKPQEAVLVKPISRPIDARPKPELDDEVPF